jgi:class 3 adenylate cyclase/tetratricopeptide (TPR) repeat protein
MVCTSCGQQNREGARFCDNCGERLSTPYVAPDVQLVVPAHLQEKIREVQRSLDGERKQVTVMFADVKGSMDIAEDVDPEDWRRVLNRFYAILTEGVHRFEGTINQYTGDGIMAIFGAPIAHEDHARRACYAALHLCNTLGLYARELRREKGLSFSVRIGLNSGEVVVGGIGPDLHMEYTAVGHTVGLASRMEHLAAPGAAYLTQATADLTAGFFEIEDLGTHDVKGVREPVRVYELKGIGAQQTRFDIARARGLSRFVGRRRETATLNSALEAVESGRGQVIGIVGEAGVGKSRLCHEFIDRARASGMRVFVAHGQPHGRAFPFQPVMELLRGYFGIGELDGPVAARQKIAGSLLLLDEEFREVLPLVFDFLGVPDPDLPLPQLDPDARLARLHVLVRHLIAASSDRGPAVILIEDLQWLDEGSRSFLAHLVGAVPDTRTLLLLNFRPEYLAGGHPQTPGPDWTASSYQQVALGPLDVDEINELIAVRIGTDRSLDELVPYVVRRTGGNPFFIEEIVQSLIGAGALVGEPGAYRLVGRLSQVSVPPTVQAIIAARLDRLGDREKNVLQTAAVIGSEFTQPVLLRASGLASFELDAALRALVDAEFVVERAGGPGVSPGVENYPELEYGFKHPLTQEVAYHSMLGDRRRRVHAAVAHAIEDAYADRIEERSPLLAHHFEEAGDNHEAALWHRRAAEWAAHNDTAVGLHHWQRVRDLVGAFPIDEAETLALAACLGVLNLGPRHGMTEAQAQSLFDEGRTLAEHLDDKRSLARLLLVFARVRGISGDVAQASELSMEAAKLAERVGLRGLRLAVAVNLASWATQFGDLRRSLELVDDALRDVPPNVLVGSEHLGYSPYIWLLMNRGRLLTYMGWCFDADDAFDRSFRLAREHGELEILCWTHQGCVDLACIRNDVPSASAHGQQAVDVAERIGTLLAKWSAYHALGRAFTLRGDAEEAIDALAKALAIMRDNRTGLHLQPLVLASLAEAQIVGGDPVIAQATAQEALEIGRAVSTDSALGVRARTILARARRLAGERELRNEEGELRRGLRILETTGYRSLEPDVRTELAELALLRGASTEHERESRRARTLRLEMGAENASFDAQHNLK